MAAEYYLKGNFYPYVVTVDGYELPGITAKSHGNGLWSFLMDGRLEITVSEENSQQWLWFVANAFAIGAGYSCFGENSVVNNPYKRKSVRVEFDISGGQVSLTTYEPID